MSLSARACYPLPYRTAIYIAVLGISAGDIPPDTIHATAEKNDGANGQIFVVCYTFL